MVIGFAVALAAGVATAGSAAADEGPCLEPIEPLPFRLERSDPLYAAALDEHRRYLEAMEDYVNCLDRERFVALSLFRESFKQFRDFFGDDARFEYDADGAVLPAVPEDEAKHRGG